MQDRLNLFDYLMLTLVLVVAASSRFGYLYFAVNEAKTAPVWQVQGDPPHYPLPADTTVRGHEKPGGPNEVDNLVHNLRENSQFSSRAPFAAEEEPTAHVAPGYSWLFSQVARLDTDADALMRWIQAGLGTLTACFYYLFARRGFGSRRVALLTGLFTALHPFWILNTAELNDGVLATFALAFVLAIGTRGSQEGGLITSVLFGLGLAGLVLIRAALLPFSIIALIWYLMSCHKQRLGSLAALVAVLFYCIPLATWIARDFQAFGEPVPVVSSAFLHVWIGNNPEATGGDMSDAMKDSLSAERKQELLEEKNQAKRYNMLGQDVLEEIRAHKQNTCTRRIQSLLKFLLGEGWSGDNPTMGRKVETGQDATAASDLVNDCAETALQGSWLFMMLFGFLGWRWSLGWRQHCRLAALATIWLPLPYILSHAGPLSGPRLPLDGVLLAFAAMAVAGSALNMPKPPLGSGEKKKK